MSAPRDELEIEAGADGGEAIDLTVRWTDGADHMQRAGQNPPFLNLFLRGPGDGEVTSSESVDAYLTVADAREFLAWLQRTIPT